MSNPNQLYLFFEKAAELFPDNYCIITEENKVTYKQVEQEVQKAYSTVMLNAKNEDFIGVPTTRCIEQIIFVLAVLKAGKAYLPIDFGYPKKRLDSIRNNSNVSFCLTTKIDETNAFEMGLKPLLVNDQSQFVDDNEIAQNDQDLATYILYTSGSTGEPKGVCMGEKAMVNLINWQNENSLSKSSLHYKL